MKGVSQLHGTEYSVIPDQIEAGTFMVAAAATCGDITLKNVIPKHLEPITAKLRKIGVYVEIEDDTDNVRVVGRPHYEGTDIKTSPHPGFPTDMQPQMTGERPQSRCGAYYCRSCGAGHYGNRRYSPY